MVVVCQFMFVLALICYYYCSDIYFTTWDKCSTRFGSHNGEAYCCKDKSGIPTPGGYYVNGATINQTCDKRKAWVVAGYFSDGYAMCLKSLRKIPYPTLMLTKTFAQTPLLTRTFAPTPQRTLARTPKRTKVPITMRRKKQQKVNYLNFVFEAYAIFDF